MNREIKFRVWDSSPEKDGFTGLMINHDYVIQSDYLIDAINGKYPIMQFTGLTDKNGKEIYEGDIVYFRANYTHKPCGWMLARIVYSDHKFVLSTGLNEYEINDETDGFDYQAEVRGNIHENPELLKP